MTSYINHACNRNAMNAFIGDMTIVRATRDIPANSEVFFGYKKAVLNYDERQKNLQHWNFKCDCVICQDNRNTKKVTLNARYTLVASANKLLNRRFDESRAVKMQNIINKLEKTYAQPAHEVPRLGIWDLYLSLANMSTGKGKFKEAAGFALDALKALGFVVEGGSIPHSPGTPLIVKRWGLMVNEVIDCWAILSRAYHLAAPDLVAQADAYAKISYRMCVGEDETFDEQYGRILLSG